jgi:truncated hemoglobin YjbI
VPNLFTRLGSEAGLTRLIDLQYEQLLADDYLGEYFMGVDIDRLKSGLLSFLRRAFGDTDAGYHGRSLQEAHRGQLVTELAFDQFVDTFVAVARGMGIGEADQTEIRTVLRATRASVITEFQPNPAYDYQSKPF